MAIRDEATKHRPSESNEACVIEPHLPGYIEDDSKKHEYCFQFMVSLKGIRCSTNSTAPMDAVKLVNVELHLATGIRVRISEGELTPLGIFNQFLRDKGSTLQ